MIHQVGVKGEAKSEEVTVEFLSIWYFVFSSIGVRRDALQVGSHESHALAQDPPVDFYGWGSYRTRAACWTLGR